VHTITTQIPRTTGGFASKKPEKCIFMVSYEAKMLAIVHKHNCNPYKKGRRENSTAFLYGGSNVTVGEPCNPNQYNYL